MPCANPTWHLFVDQPLYPNLNTPPGRLVLIQGEHSAREPLTDPPHTRRFPDGDSTWVEFCQPFAGHAHTLSYPSEPISVPEPGPLLSQFVCVVVIAMLARRRARRSSSARQRPSIATAGNV